MIASRTSVAAALGATDHASATTPAACGVAIDVPLSSANPSKPKPRVTVELGDPFKACPSAWLIARKGRNDGTRPAEEYEPRLGTILPIAFPSVNGTLSNTITPMAPAVFALTAFCLNVMSGSLVLALPREISAMFPWTDAGKSLGDPPKPQKTNAPD